MSVLQVDMLLLLFCFSEKGVKKLSIREISRKTSAKLSEVKKSLKKLEEDGYVTVSKDECSLTEEGTQSVLSYFETEKRLYWSILEKDKFMMELREWTKSKDELIRDLLNEERTLMTHSKWDNIFLVARRWNSYTPALPAIESLGFGGGYFLAWNGKGLVIDPGYNFLRILRECTNKELGLVDIDGILITHDHPDHTAGLEDILTLIREENRIRKHHLDLFCNIGALYKFEYRITKLSRYITCYPLRPGTTLDLSEKYNFTIHATPAFHKETWGESKYSIGTIFDLHKKCRIGITSDTRWHQDLISAYLGTDLLVMHLGTLEAKNSALPNHLGSLGAYLLLKHVHPKLSLVSEFGEELKGQGRYMIGKFLSRIFSKKSMICKVLPADIGLTIKLPSLDVYCQTCNAFHAFQSIDFKEFGDEIKYVHLKGKL